MEMGTVAPRSFAFASASRRVPEVAEDTHPCPPLWSELALNEKTRIRRALWSVVTENLSQALCSSLSKNFWAFAKAEWESRWRC